MILYSNLPLAVIVLVDISESNLASLAHEVLDILEDSVRGLQGVT